MAKTQGKPGRTTPTPAKSSSAAAAASAAASETRRPGRKVKVRALRMGYYGEKRRREGDVFVYTFGPKEKNELPTWVEEVDPGTPERITTGKDDLRRQHDELLAARMPGSGASSGVHTDGEDNNPLGA